MTSETVTRPVPAAKPVRPRKFGVWDAMVATAATALALAGGLKLILGFAEQLLELCKTVLACNTACYAKQPAMWRHNIAIYGSTILWYSFRLSETLLLSMAPAVLLMRLGRPRPPLGALLRQPGVQPGGDTRLRLGHGLAAPPFLREVQHRAGYRHGRRWQRGPGLGVLGPEPEMGI